MASSTLGKTLMLVDEAVSSSLHLLAKLFCISNPATAVASVERLIESTVFSQDKKVHVTTTAKIPRLPSLSTGTVGQKITWSKSKDFWVLMALKSPSRSSTASR
jgi:hypothetical protein